MKRSAPLTAAAALSATALAALSFPARADTTVLGGGFAEACWRAAVDEARDDEEARPDYPAPDEEDLAACDSAVKEDFLSRRDLAATLVNRGVLYMGLERYEAAQSDFDRAVSLAPTLPEAYANRGAVLVSRRNYRDGVSEITRALAMNPDQPAKSYYNRGIAYEALGDLKSAYYDYIKASELWPEWSAPRAELVRFKVERK